MKGLRGIELSHHYAPLAIREKIGLTHEAVMDSLRLLSASIPGCFIISTCNRLALYGMAESAEEFEPFFNRFGALDSYLIKLSCEEEVIRHLFSTAAGLQSQALGEHEILGQLKRAHAQAKEAGTLNAALDELIRKSISTGKKVRRETAIGKYPVSLASVAFDLIRNRNKNFSKQNMLVLGTGEMSNLMMKILGKNHHGRLYVASNTPARAQSMAAMYGASPIAMSDISAHLGHIDIIVGATHTEEYILSESSLKKHTERELTLLDLGMPRNFAPEIKRLGHVNLFDLDDLKSLTDKSIIRRQEEIPKAQAIIDSEAENYMAWLKTKTLGPMITSYYQRVDKIRQEELNWALPKLGDISSEQRRIIESMLDRMARKMSGKPIEKLRKYAQEPLGEECPMATFKSLFDL